MVTPPGTWTNVIKALYLIFSVWNSFLLYRLCDYKHIYDFFFFFFGGGGGSYFSV